MNVAAHTGVQLAVDQPWILDVVPEARREWVTSNLVVPALRVGRGEFNIDDLPRPVFGLMVLDGLIVRRIEVRGYAGAALLGESDVLRSWTYQGHVATIPARARFTALTDLRFAALDNRFAEVVRLVPELAVALVERAVERSRAQAFFLAIRASVRIEERLLLTFWHLAERWGRVTPEGVRLLLPRVSHDLLAEVIGARRPSVTTGVNALERRGALVRRDKGTWLLRGHPPDVLASLDD